MKFLRGRPIVSLCMILKDAEETVARALDSVAGLYDEIVVVLDSGTTDGTAAVLERYGARVKEKVWTGFADARNRGFEMARGDWLLVLDGDEELVDPGDFREKLAEAMTSEDVDGITFKIQSVIGGDVRLGAIGDQPRVVRRADRIRWKFAIHNQLRGYRAASMLKSSALLHAHYPVSYDSRWERNEGKLLAYRSGFAPATEEWRHATAYLCRGATCIADHVQTIRYAQELIAETPEHAHPSVWSALVGAMVRLGADGTRIDETIDLALSYQPRNVDVLWWRMHRRFAPAALEWARAAQHVENYAVDCWSTQFVDSLPDVGRMLGMSFVKRGSGDPE